MLSMDTSSSSSPAQNHYKNATESISVLGVPPAEGCQPNDMQNSFQIWLGHDENLSSLGDVDVDVDDLVVPEIFNFDCPSNISIGDHDAQYLPDSCKIYPNCSNVFLDNLSETGLRVGYYHYCTQNGHHNNAVMHHNCVPSYYSHLPATAMENRGVQGEGEMTSITCGDNNIRVGRYSVEERRARILRYLKKRNQRNFNKTIKYACRKALADRRVRIHGRFAKNHEDDHPLTNHTATTHQEDNFVVPYININNVDKNGEYYDDDEWLQQAMASLMSIQCIPAWHAQPLPR